MIEDNYRNESLTATDGFAEGERGSVSSDAISQSQNIRSFEPLTHDTGSSIRLINFLIHIRLI